MGADQKRKDARKRKFGAQSWPANAESESAIVNIVTKKEASDQRNSKKLKQKKEDEAVDKSTETRDANSEGARYTIARGTQPQDKQNESVEHTVETKKQRFIVFIGNLPFSATDGSIAAHFAKVHPKSIRHRIEKATGTSKGFAFLEFEAYDRMKTCLKMYHHSTFDDGENPPRRLNVELTVGGGGGKSQERKAKLREKNIKLNEERQRRAVEGSKQANAEGKKKIENEVKGRDAVAKGIDAVELAPPVDRNGDIHPSRRSRMHQT